MRRSVVPAALAVGVLVTGCWLGSDASAVPGSGPSAKSPAAARQTTATTPFRAFSSDSWWNARLPRKAPKSPIAAQILDYMSTGPDADGGCVRLAGTGSNKWGQPVYWAGSGDPEYDVRTGSGRRPRELARVRIPVSAEAAATSDAAMTVFDRQRGYVVAFTGAHYANGTWTARGATVTRLASNGLHSRLKRSDTKRNLGSHRGNNGATMMVRYDEVAAGAVRHVVKVSSGPETSSRSVFPMVGSDGGSSNPAAPPQGLRFRIKPSVDLDALHLNAQALVIARGLQKYGMYLGDSGGHTTLKLENTRATSGQQRWKLSSNALCKIPLTPRFWDVVRPGYDPSR